MSKKEPPMRTAYRTDETRDALILLLPLLLLSGIFIAYPVLSNFRFAFLDWKGFGKPRWVGFKNFQEMFASPMFRVSLLNTAKLLLYIPLSVSVTVVMAAFLREGLRCWGFFRAVLYIPNLLGPVIMGVVLSVVLRESGPFNELLKGLGLGFLASDWLGAERLSIHVVGLLQVVWVRLGFGIIYFLSAMSAIDPALYEAALMDGASWWKRFFHVTVPSVAFGIEFWTVLSFIEVFARMFGFIFSLTKGVRFQHLHTGIRHLLPGLLQHEEGMASAWATVLFFFCALISIAQLRLMKEHGL
jgi:ABC-type sugar transport system permease subunit